MLQGNVFPLKTLNQQQSAGSSFPSVSNGAQNLFSCQAATHSNSSSAIHTIASTSHPDNINQPCLNHSPRAYTTISKPNDATAAGSQLTFIGNTAAFLYPGNPPNVSLERMFSTVTPSNMNIYPKASLCSRLFVGQVPELCSEEQLRTIFAMYGNLLEVKIMREFSGKSKGSAWVRYETEEMARRAIEALHGKRVFERQTNALRVQFAAPPKKGIPLITTTSSAPVHERQSASATVYPMTSYPAQIYASPSGLSSFSNPSHLSIDQLQQQQFYSEMSSSPMSYSAPASLGPGGTTRFHLDAAQMMCAHAVAPSWQTVASYAYPTAPGTVVVKQGEGFPLLPQN